MKVYEVYTSPIDSKKYILNIEAHLKNTFVSVYPKTEEEFFIDFDITWVNENDGDSFDWKLNDGEAIRFIEKHFPQHLSLVHLKDCNVNGESITSFLANFYNPIILNSGLSMFSDTELKNGLRIDDIELHHLRSLETVDQIKEWVAMQRPRWKKEAEDVIKKYDLRCE